MHFIACEAHPRHTKASKHGTLVLRRECRHPHPRLLARKLTAARAAKAAHAAPGKHGQKRTRRTHHGIALVDRPVSPPCWDPVASSVCALLARCFMVCQPHPAPSPKKASEPRVVGRCARCELRADESIDSPIPTHGVCNPQNRREQQLRRRGGRRPEGRTANGVCPAGRASEQALGNPHQSKERGDGGGGLLTCAEGAQRVRAGPEVGGHRHVSPHLAWRLGVG